MSTKTLIKENIKKSYKLYKPKKMKINSVEKIKSITKIKKYLPSRHALTNKFYESLKSTWSQYSKPKRNSKRVLDENGDINGNVADS